MVWIFAPLRILHNITTAPRFPHKQAPGRHFSRHLLFPYPPQCISIQTSVVLIISHFPLSVTINKWKFCLSTIITWRELLVGENCFGLTIKILNYSPPQFACSANQRPKSTTKKTHKPLRTSWFSEKCLVFDNHKNLILTLAAWSAFLALFTWSPRTTCAKDHRLFKKSLPTNQRKPRSHDHKPRWSNTR